ncbi:DUF6115 domain-containing protein [Virgibacillus salexigens]|uniref:DUF6115 domain-containing protein n=1 Tax=Virgibacillus salexigens TaxID=61016 RepID=UPI00190D6CB5|nr:helix-turn-helix domain-containing protein [Virgibacillus salexigens]
MTSFLLIISFLLHGISFITIYYLLKLSRSQQVNANELQTLLASYLDEIKTENQHLERQLSQGVTNEANYSKEQIAANPDAAGEQSNEENIDLPISEMDQVEASLQARVLQMYSNGKSITEIARELNCGKTEAELIIKFQFHQSIR